MKFCAGVGWVGWVGGGSEVIGPVTDANFKKFNLSLFPFLFRILRF